MRNDAVSFDYYVEGAVYMKSKKA